MVSPAVLSIIGSAVKSGVGGFTEAKKHKSAKKRLQEEKNQTIRELLDDALQRSGELETHKLSTRSKLAGRKGQSMQETADILRGAFSI